MRAFLLGAALLASGACGGGNDPGPGPDPTDPTDPDDPPTPEETARDYDEVANILGAHVRGEFALQLAGAAITESQPPEGFSITSQAIEESAGVGTSGSMNYEFWFYCNDGSQAHTKVPCNGAAHHSHIKFVATGSQAIGAMAMEQITRTVDWEIRDITLDKARFRGPDSVSLQTQIATEGETAAYKISFDAVYEKVRFLAGQQIPTYGTITFTINADRTRGDDHRVFNATAVLVYGASGAPTTLTIDGMHNYTIDLTSGEIVKL